MSKRAYEIRWPDPEWPYAADQYVKTVVRAGDPDQAWETFADILVEEWNYSEDEAMDIMRNATIRRARGR